MGNSSGNSSERRTLQYYERLPRSVRAAVANARFDWALKNWLRMFEDGRISAKELVERILRVDAEQASKERSKVWGEGYPIPKGDVPVPKPSRKAAGRKERG